MVKRTCAFVSVLALLLAAAGSAKAGIITIDFESLRHDDALNTGHGDLYSEDGFTLTETGSQDFHTFGTLEFRFSGSTSLFSDTIGGTITMTEDDGSEFGLISINLAELNASAVANVTFTGVLPTAGTTSQTFTIDGVAFGQETFFFNPTFAALTSVSWTQASPFHQFDNIVVDDLIPEPATLSLLGLGLLAVARRRRRH